jgi:5'-deoxynucleotidase YfbR-like HD superfamily hydrolase
MSKKDVTVIAENLLNLQKLYSTTYRAMVTEERYNLLIRLGKIKEYTVDSLFIREPLIEHVGHLPLIASYLHEHIKHKENVDLGRVLIMLSIHDIGETAVGDVFAYSKTESDTVREIKSAKKLLPDYLFKYFIEAEGQQTYDSKFAKSVDSIAPILHELASPDNLMARFSHYHYNAKTVKDRKQGHFLWDVFLTDIFDFCMVKFVEIEKSFFSTR